MASQNNILHQRFDSFRGQLDQLWLGRPQQPVGIPGNRFLYDDGFGAWWGRGARYWICSDGFCARDGAVAVPVPEVELQVVDAWLRAFCRPQKKFSKSTSLQIAQLIERCAAHL